MADPLVVLHHSHSFWRVHESKRESDSDVIAEPRRA